MEEAVGIKMCLGLVPQLYIGGWGRELGPPNREIVSFRSCVRAVLVKSFRSEKVDLTPCIFYLSSRELVSFICCDFGFFVNSY